MTTLHKIHEEAMVMALLSMQDAATLATKSKHPKAVQAICTAVANLIAGAGAYGSSGQSNMMDLASKRGFAPEFYNNGVRVTFNALKKEAPRVVCKGCGADSPYGAPTCVSCGRDL